VQNLIKGQISGLQESLDKEKQAKIELEFALTKERSEKDELKSQLESAKKAERILTDLNILAGYTASKPTTSVNRMINSKSDAPQGALKDWFDIYENSGKVIKVRANGSPIQISRQS
jgi:hypothetical protein